MPRLDGGRPLAQQRDRAHDPWASLRLRNFQYFLATRTISGVASNMQQAAVAWQVYELSGSAVKLGFLGLARFVPAMALLLVGGAVADNYDRRKILIAAQAAPLLSALVLLLTTVTGTISVPIIYATVFFNSMAQSFENPARQAIVPLVVPRSVFANAVTISSTFQELAMVAGPAVAGLLIAVSDVASVYGVNALLTVAGVATMFLTKLSGADLAKRRITVSSIFAGWRYVWRRQPILGAMSLDMFAVIFGGAQAMLPIYAKDILGVGADGYGLLSAALPAGAFIMAVIMVFIPPIERVGRTLLLTVTVFGVVTILFGLSRIFALSLLGYGMVGGADQISKLMRQMTVQLTTPDALRGRVSSVHSLFVNASSPLGQMESGLVAAWTSPTFAVVSGGFGTLAVVALIAWAMPELRRFRIDHHGVATAAEPAATPAGVR